MKRKLYVTLFLLITALGISGCTNRIGETPASKPENAAVQKEETNAAKGGREIKQVNRKIKDIPVLEFYTDNGSKKPLLIVSHGFSGSKESLNKDKRLEALAQMDYHVVALDNRMHGERQGDKFVDIVKSKGKVDLIDIRRAIKETADDVKTLIDSYAQEKLVDNKRIGMLGTSMGGFITYRTLAIDERIKVAVPLISSPFWDDIPGDMKVALDVPKEDLEVYSEKFSPGNQTDKFHPRAILGQIGDGDKHFKPERVTEFYNKVKENYKGEPDKLKLIVYSGIKHEVTSEMWDNAMEWLGKYL